MKLNPGCEAQYQRLHDEIWPELVAECGAAGYTSYSIWRSDAHLFVYFECDDLERAKEQGAQSAAAHRWAKQFESLIVMDIDPHTSFPRLLPCVWDLEATP